MVVRVSMLMRSAVVGGVIVGEVRIAESTKVSLQQRLRERAVGRWSAVSEVTVRFRAGSPMWTAGSRAM